MIEDDCRYAIESNYSYCFLVYSPVKSSKILTNANVKAITFDRKFLHGQWGRVGGDNETVKFTSLTYYFIHTHTHTHRRS